MDRKIDEMEEEDQFMYYILEKAESTLAEWRNLPLEVFKSILFQVLFALYTSQVFFL